MEPFAFDVDESDHCYLTQLSLSLSKLYKLDSPKERNKHVYVIIMTRDPVANSIGMCKLVVES